MLRLFSTPNLLRVYRLGVLVTLAWLVHAQARWFEARRQTSITIEQARRFFPGAERVELRDTTRGLHFALDEGGEPLGALLRTAPQTDHIVGYSGPNDLLIALDKEGAIAGVEVLRSGDTEDHVDLVLRDKSFLQRFVGWKPGSNSAPKIEGVSGATLTSFAMAEAVQQKLSGTALSLRFPEPIELAEVRTLFTNAARFSPDGRRYRVFDENDKTLGFVLRSSPESDNVSGYRGPTEVLIGVGADSELVTGVRVRRSFDTPSYVDQIRDDDYYLNLFRGRTLAQLATLDFKKEKIEGVSGATETSYAIAEGLKRRAAAEVAAQTKSPPWKPRARDYGLLAVITGASLMAFTSLRGNKWMRVGWQILLVGYIGLVNADLLSLALLGGWATHGVVWQATPALLLLAALAVLVPLISRRQLYCHQICPHGAAQQLIGNISRRRWSVPVPLSKWLERGPVLLLLAALVALVTNWPLDLANLEAFDAWAWRAAGIATVVIAVVGLIASFFIPQAYCRFGCPTGALLNFVRTSGSGDRWGRRDWTGLLFLFVAGVAVVATRAMSSPAETRTITLAGRTMGTTWMVKVRDFTGDARKLERAVKERFDWCEQMTSHWRSNTPVAQFNAARTTNALPVPEPVLALVRSSEEISRATGGAFDITVGPLVKLWGFGPPPRRTNAPSESEIAAIMPAVGWQKLNVRGSALQKTHPAVGMDLSAIAPGWAIDEVAKFLKARKVTAFLIESGGELRARGPWPIAIEHPGRTYILRNLAIGTSGTYRHNRKSQVQQLSHLIDPRTGRPVSHQTVSVSVLHTNCALADAWAAALNVIGDAKGRPLAEQLSLAAQFVVQHGDGSLEVRSTTEWTHRSSVTDHP